MQFRNVCQWQCFACQVCFKGSKARRLDIQAPSSRRMEAIAAIYESCTKTERAILEKRKRKMVPTKLLKGPPCALLLVPCSLLLALLFWEYHRSYTGPAASRGMSHAIVSTVATYALRFMARYLLCWQGLLGLSGSFVLIRST